MTTEELNMQALEEIVYKAAIIDLAPSDVVVLKSLRRLTLEQAELIQDQFRKASGLPNAVVILPPEIDLGGVLKARA